MLRAAVLATAAVAAAVTWHRRGLKLPPRFVPKAACAPVKQLPPALRATEDDSDSRASASASAPSTSAPSNALEADASEPAAADAAAAAARAPAVQWPDDRGGDATPAMPRTGEEPPPLSDETQERLVGSLGNEALAHRVIMDPQFQLSKGHGASMQGGKQVHAQVEAAMKRAYWDMIRQQTAAGDYKMMLDNLREVKERLRSFLPKSRADMHAALQANFDVDFLEQQLTHKAFDGDTLATLLHTALGTIEQLEAPYRNATTRGWLAETQQRISSHPMGWEALLPDIFDFVHGKLEEMGLDVLNWQLRSIAPWLQMHGVAYENDNFNRLLAANQVSLNVTRSWAAATCAAVAAGEQPGMPWVLSAADHALCTAAPSSPADSLPPDTREWILARYGVLLLLCRPMALDRGCCPEVLWLDLPFLVETQNTLQAVTLIGALLMITTAHLREQGATVGADEVRRFKNDVLTLLAHPMGSVRLISDYMQRFVAKLRADQGLPALTEEERTFLGRMTDKTASTEDAFYRSMNKTVLSTLWQCLRAHDDAAADAVLAGVRTAMKDEVASMSRTLRRMVVHNHAVHQRRLAPLFASALPPSPAAAAAAAAAAASSPPPAA